MKFASPIPLFCLILIGLFMVACTEKNAGPMPAWTSGASYPGRGFYLSAVLDSGRRVHALHDTLRVDLDSLWLVSRCYLSSIQSSQSIQDSAAYLGYSLYLNSNPNVMCPASPLGGDTMLLLPPSSSWSNVRILRILGAVDSLVMDYGINTLASNVNDSSLLLGAVKDSIWILNGSNKDSTFNFTIDSLFWRPHNLPRDTGNGPYVVRIVRNILPVTDTWTFQTQSCARVSNNTCALVLDTVWGDTIVNDTALIANIRKHCTDTTLTSYCSGTNYWTTDSVQAGGTYSIPDTVWSMNTFYVEQIPACAVLNRDAVLNFNLTQQGGDLVFKRELFVPAPTETRCGIPWTVSDTLDSIVTTHQVNFAGTFLANWLVYNVDLRTIVTDTALADSVIFSVTGKHP